jgi:hypothetical protein
MNLVELRYEYLGQFSESVETRSMGGAYQKVENRITESTQNVNDLKSGPLSLEAGMTEVSSFFPRLVRELFFRR